MGDKKYSLHTSFEERKRQHRTVARRKGWGLGVSAKPKFSLKLLHPYFWNAWAAVLLLKLLVTVLPYPLLMLLGRKLGLLMARFIPSRKYVAARNLELAFPTMPQFERDRLCRLIFENSGMAIFETGMAWFWSDRRLLKHAKIDPEELAAAKALAQSPGSRILVLTCHFVTLEIMARLYALLIKPGVGVYRPSDHPVWEYVQVKGRLRSNVALVDRNDPRSMIRALMQGYPIWYAPDQDYGPKVSIFAPFFGVDQAATVTGTRDLAKVRGTKVQPAWTIRRADGYHLHVLAPLTDFPDYTKDELHDIKRCNQVIENMIKMAPDQYLWLHRRFKTAPPGEANRYPEL